MYDDDIRLKIMFITTINSLNDNNLDIHFYVDNWLIFFLKKIDFFLGDLEKLFGIKKYEISKFIYYFF